MKNQKMFLVFGTLEALALGVIIYLIFHSLNVINGADIIGLDTQILLSILFPAFLLVVQYMIYTKKS